ncbi:MAG: hypothetical protein AAF191_05110 [Verrucomicrobiota bacterium]
MGELRWAVEASAPTFCCGRAWLPDALAVPLGFWRWLMVGAPLGSRDVCPYRFFVVGRVVPDAPGFASGGLAVADSPVLRWQPRRLPLPFFVVGRVVPDAPGFASGVLAVADSPGLRWAAETSASTLFSW